MAEYCLPLSVFGLATVQLISYEQFAKLRLRDFLPDVTVIGEVFDWQWMGSSWYNEGFGFTSFSQHVSTPGQTGALEISFPELPDHISERLLSAIGLPLRPGMNATEVLSVMGAPAETHRFVSDANRTNF